MDDILDFDWVLSKETQIEEKEATLFQQCASTDILLIGANMLYENNIPYQIKQPKTDETNNFSPFQEIHIPENHFKKANLLFNQLLNENPSYPKRLPDYNDYSDEELKMMLDSMANPYKELLIKIELKKRGVNLEEDQKAEKEVIANPILIILFIIFIIAILKIWSLNVGL